MTMGLQAAKELKFLKIAAIGMPIMLLAGFVFFGLQIWYADRVAKPVVRILEFADSSATLCGNHLVDLESLKNSFIEITINKLAGSSPIRLEKFHVKGGSNEHTLELGMDSLNSNTFWVYSEGGQLNKFVAGFIKSPYLATEFQHCE